MDINWSFHFYEHLTIYLTHLTNLLCIKPKAKFEAFAMVSKPKLLLYVVISFQTNSWVVCLSYSFLLVFVSFVCFCLFVTFTSFHFLFLLSNFSHFALFRFKSYFQQTVTTSDFWLQLDDQMFPKYLHSARRWYFWMEVSDEKYQFESP